MLIGARLKVRGFGDVNIGWDGMEYHLIDVGGDEVHVM